MFHLRYIGLIMTFIVTAVNSFKTFVPLRKGVVNILNQPSNVLINPGSRVIGRYMSTMGAEGDAGKSSVPPLKPSRLLYFK